MAEMTMDYHRFDDATWWAGVWLAAWQKAGGDVGLDANSMWFGYGIGRDERDGVAQSHLTMLKNLTPNGNQMLCDYLERYGNGPVNLYPFNPRPVSDDVGRLAYN